MYNKRFFRKINDKKVLHKVGKRWAILSFSLLGTLGLTGMVTSQAHADNVDNSVPNSASSVNNSQDQSMQAKLIPSVQSNQPENANYNNSNDPLNNEANGINSIKAQAHTLYRSIILNGLKHLSQHPTVTQTSNQNNRSNTNLTTNASHTNITGQWGTAPFQFNSTTGQLQTISGGTITPISKLSRVPFSDVRSIQFAPGTQAPRNSTGLFQASDIEIPTTDGHYGSDSIAYVSALQNLKKIDLTNLDTSQVTSMAKMFGNDSGLQHITFGPHFNTSKVKEMAEMFQSDDDLKSLDLSSFNTSNVLDMSSMFKSDYALSEINLGNHFNTHYVSYMSDMFQSDNDLKSLDLGPNFYLNLPQNLSNMFADDYYLTSLNLGIHFNTHTVTNMSDMFAYDSDLDSLDLGPLFYTAQVSDMHDLFKDDANLRTVNLGSHFDTTKASTKQYTTNHQVSSNSYNGAPGAYESYPGAKGIFNGDQSLSQIQMDNAKLVGPVDLLVPTLTAWYLSDQSQAKGVPVNLNDGYPHSGKYQLISTDPVVTTDLNFQDVNHNNQSIGDILINGLKGTNIPFATISNALGAGYVSAIPISNLMKTFPNVPYQYRLGVVNIPVKKVSNESTNGNNSPVTPNDKSESNAVNSYMASLADQKIANYYQSSVTSSVSVSNQQKAKLAAASADQSIDDSIANSAAKSADQQIESSIAESYANQADQKIKQSYQNSVSVSVSIKNQSLATNAASSADRRIESSIATSYASSADQRIEQSEQASVASSVSAQDQQIQLSETITKLDTKPSVQEPVYEPFSSSVSQFTVNKASSLGKLKSRSASSMRQDNNDRNAPVNALKIGQNLQIGNRIVSRTPVKYRKARIIHNCLAHNHIISVGKVEDYSGTLKKGTVIQIKKTFRVKVNHQIFNRYEIILNHHHYFVTANSLYATSAYVQPDELRHHYAYGTKAHRYYHVVINKPCMTYWHGHREKRLRHGKIVHVKGIVYTGRKSHRVEHLMLTNGQLITADKAYVKIK